jgi:serine/threonine protein kinase
MNVVMEECQARLRAVLLEHGYEMLDRIGVGSHAGVYTVLSSRYAGMTFVAKVIEFSSAHASIAEVFNQETDILMQLGHPHIVSLFDKISTTTEYILILEYCQNGTIDHFVRVQKLPVSAILRMARQTLQALAHCHSIGIAHRDLKPANILVDVYGRAKLVDFGLSVFVAHQDGPSFAGSLSYMAPEVFMQTGSPDLFSADIWSLGITFYCLFAGESPWPRMLRIPDLQRVIAAGIQGFPDKIRPDIQDLIRRMTTLAPTQRPTAQQLLVDPIFNRVLPQSRVAPPLAGRRLSSPSPFGGTKSPSPTPNIAMPTFVLPGVKGTIGQIVARRHSSGSGASRTPAPVKPVLPNSPH